MMRSPGTNAVAREVRVSREADFIIDIDEDPETYDKLVKAAIERAREIASSDPEQARNGFRLAVRDEANTLLFEVAFVRVREQATLH